MAAKPAVRRLNNAATVMNVKETNVGIFVAISVGTKDRVKLGDKLVVSRNQNRVGTLDIIRVSKDSAIGRFQANNNNAIPQVNDKVGR